MEQNSNALLEYLMADVRQLLLQARQLETLDESLLNTSPGQARWSTAQILEHLNFYSAYYLRTIEEKMHHNQHPPSESFKPGLLGNYFTKMMKPSDAQQVKNKMKTMKAAVPPVDTDGKKALAQFVADQHALLNLLQIAKHTNLNLVKVPISISKWLSLKLGDTFRFFIAHEQRHFVQIGNTLADLKAGLQVAAQ